MTLYECDNCGELFTGNYQIRDDEIHFCYDCINIALESCNYGECDICDRLFLMEDLNYIDDVLMCQKCYIENEHKVQLGEHD